MIRAGIIGGAGYTAGELIRLLLAHPHGRHRLCPQHEQRGKPPSPT